MARIEGQRRQDWEYLLLEVLAQQFALLALQFVVIEHLDPGLFQFRQDVEMPAIRVPGQIGQQLATDGGQLLGRRHAIRRRFDCPSLQLSAQAGNTDHEELVQVAGKNGQKLDPLQQGMALIQRFFQHLTVELKPAQFAVDV